jgi:hypothetical protein
MAGDGAGEPQNYDIVGPVYETGDLQGKARQLHIEAPQRWPQAC